MTCKIKSLDEKKKHIFLITNVNYLLNGDNDSIQFLSHCCTQLIIIFDFYKKQRDITIKQVISYCPFLNSANGGLFLDLEISY